MNEQIQELNQNFLEDYDERVIALAQHLELNLEPDFESFVDEDDTEEAKTEAIKEVTDELDSIVEDCTNTFRYYDEEYLVLTDEEADEKWDEELDYYLEELVYPELPEHLRGYFDDEAWKEDAKTDGRGHAISRYDGYEYEETVNGVTYFIYRI